MFIILFRTNSIKSKSIEINSDFGRFAVDGAGRAAFAGQRQSIGRCVQLFHHSPGNYYQGGTLRHVQYRSSRLFFPSLTQFTIELTYSMNRTFEQTQKSSTADPAVGVQRIGRSGGPGYDAPVLVRNTYQPT